MKLGLVKEQGYMEEVREAVGHHRLTGSRPPPRARAGCTSHQASHLACVRGSL